MSDEQIIIYAIEAALQLAHAVIVSPKQNQILTEYELPNDTGTKALVKTTKDGKSESKEQEWAKPQPQTEK